MSWEGGHEFVLRCAGLDSRFTVTVDSYDRPRDLFHWFDVATVCGEITFEKPGKYTLTLLPEKLCFEKGLGPKLKSVTLTALK